MRQVGPGTNNIFFPPYPTEIFLSLLEYARHKHFHFQDIY